ncbi:uncharacterized protein EI90DRAFT_3015769 [Cantharellus anzutake]|uniref:uncharacterized protein n=1 Tax=Cantharellus anzutake TaxID=1750568 RepID=UPI001907F541|nr:uncharacterized protein EI90DRAFT_3015769 [Cantharellus anzutake]KAF8332733.1 hypothetical protein EI90DRAFT_3015769 [Cantharellus anzutake]
MFGHELVEQPIKWLPQHAKPGYKKDMDRSSQLGKALHDWRKAEFSQRYPDQHDSIWIGDWIVLGNLIIDDIIYLANCNKLLNQQDFIQLVDWEERGYYTSELLPIIHQIFPPAVPPSAQPSTPVQSNTVFQPCTKKCGNCKKHGHNELSPEWSY